METIIQSVIQAITRHLPVQAELHERVLTQYTDFAPIPTELKASIQLGALGAILFAFRYDWMGMFFGLLRALSERRRLMTLDERLPLFMLLSLLPIWILKSFITALLSPLWTTQIISGSILLSGFLPLLGWVWSRQSHTNLDWTPLKALLVGLLLLLTVLPGWDPLCIIFVAGLLLHFQAKTAMRYAYYLYMPLTLLECSQMQMPSLNKEVIIGFGASFLLGTFTILHFEKKLQKGAFFFQIIHRLLITALAVLFQVGWIQR